MRTRRLATAEATRYTAELEQRWSRGATGPFALALAYAGQGKLSQAFEYLDRAIRVRDIFMPEDFFDPLLAPLRADPRFARIEEADGDHALAAPGRSPSGECRTRNLHRGHLQPMDSLLGTGTS